MSLEYVKDKIDKKNNERVFMQVKLYTLGIVFLSKLFIKTLKFNI